jgi:hypothetical protein
VTVVPIHNRFNEDHLVVRRAEGVVQVSDRQKISFCMPELIGAMAEAAAQIESGYSLHFAPEFL